MYVQYVGSGQERGRLAITHSPAASPLQPLHSRSRSGPASWSITMQIIYKTAQVVHRFADNINSVKMRVAS